MSKISDGVVLVPVPIGDLVDKITILRIKTARISDPGKLANVRLELSALEQVFRDLDADMTAEMKNAIEQLHHINERLWTIEDDIRACERAGDFGDRFVALARSVYQCNDLRARIKRDVNVLMGSRLIEEKSYANNQTTTTACP